jgi:Uma2 family endonuclease
MTIAKPRVVNFENYLALSPVELPECRTEYWDGELVQVMSESIENLAIASFLFLQLVAAGIPFQLIHPHACEIVVPGRPRTRFPDLVVLDPVHLPLLKTRATLTMEMPPPTMVAEVVSPGDEDSENYQRDYGEKSRQYAERGIPEYWLVDPQRACVMVGLLQERGYVFQEFRGEDPILSGLLGTVHLTAAQVFSAAQASL